MKTRLLRKLRREANKHFQFRIILEPTFGVWADVMSFGESVYFTCDGKKGAEKFCRKAYTTYILGRVKFIKDSNMYLLYKVGNRKGKRMLQKYLKQL